MSTEHCRSPKCRAPIIWALTETGARIPIDSEPRADGNLVVVMRRGQTHALSYDAEKHGAGPRRTSHFATCPDATRWRRAPAPLQLCPCGQTMRRCDDCGALVCTAPGHMVHICEAGGVAP